MVESRSLYGGMTINEFSRTTYTHLFLYSFGLLKGLG